MVKSAFKDVGYLTPKVTCNNVHIPETNKMVLMRWLWVSPSCCRQRPWDRIRGMATIPPNAVKKCWKTEQEDYWSCLSNQLLQWIYLFLGRWTNVGNGFTGNYHFWEFKLPEFLGWCKGTMVVCQLHNKLVCLYCLLLICLFSGRLSTHRNDFPYPQSGEREWEREIHSYII